MKYGILIGLISAFLQSVTFVLSRRFIAGKRTPLELTLYANLAMGCGGFVILLLLLPHISLPVTDPRFWCAIFFFALGSMMGNWCFFKALQDIEASRLSSLLGLKLLVLTPLNMLFVRYIPGVWQYLAIILATISAVGMNFAGGAMKLRGIFFLTITLFCYSSSDIAAGKLTNLIGTPSLTINALCAACLGFSCSALVPVVILRRKRFEASKFKAAIPYSICWLTAMTLLFASFGLVGVLYGTILQAARGMFSVLLGWVLFKTGIDRFEPQVSAGAWIRRGVMALLMIGAIGCYTVR